MTGKGSTSIGGIWAERVLSADAPGEMVEDGRPVASLLDEFLLKKRMKIH
jgi:hypothetical protein